MNAVYVTWKEKMLYKEYLSKPFPFFSDLLMWDKKKKLDKIRITSIEFPLIDL